MSHEFDFGEFEGLKHVSIDLKTIISMADEGMCYADCEHECIVEPDGICEHGNESVMLVLGLI